MADGSAVQALGGVDLEISSGVITALVGADGAGKTTFLRMICALMSPDSGTLSVLGEEVPARAQSVQRRISYMPQRFGLYEDLTVQENLDLYADLHGVPMPERSRRYEKLLSMTDLTAFTARPAGKLSGGMKQKLGLACTLVRLPELLVLDEPSVGVDPLSRLELWNIVSALSREEHLTVLWATSYMDEAEKADEIAVMHEGRILQTGRPDELTGRVRGLTFTVEPLPGQKPRALQAELYDRAGLVADAVPRVGRVSVVARSEAAACELCSLYGERISGREPRFEDAFMTLIGRPSDGRAMYPASGAGAPSSSVQDGVPVIEVRDLVRRFGSFIAVNRTSFEVGRGEIFGLLGPNGAGKTTTFRMLCGLLPASEGSLRVAGCDLRRAAARARGRIGYVAQKFALYGNLSVRQNLMFFGGAYGLRGQRLRERVQHAASLFSLPLEESAERLALGYKRRLAMAAALLHEPEILFLDEPTSGIDPQARREFWRLITHLAAGGITIIVTTHFMEEAEYCDRMAIQDAGRLLALGSPRELLERAAGGSARDMNEAFIELVRDARGGEGAHA